MSAETELRALWTAKGVAPDRQDQLIAQIEQAAAPGAPVGPWHLPFASEPTEQGNQLVIPGCEKEKTRGPKQMDLF